MWLFDSDSVFYQAEPLKVCEDCGGSGICSACNGEGFILKKLSEESADRARMTAKNMATRYTAGYAWILCFTYVVVCFKLCA